MKYFEDFQVGDVEHVGKHELGRAEAIAFAAAYDPQPFHLDDAAAAANPIFGRLSASGWHTALIAMRLVAEHSRRTGARAVGSPGLDELRWLKPVYPGDVLRVETEVIAKSTSRTRPGIGFVKVRTVVFNQNGDPVLRQVATTMQPRRPEAAERSGGNAN